MESLRTWVLEKVCVSHSCYHAGDGCARLCLLARGSVYRFMSPGRGPHCWSTPFGGQVLPKLEENCACHLCGEIFTAPGSRRSRARANTMRRRAIGRSLKYGTGLFLSTAWRSCTRVSSSSFPASTNGKSLEKDRRQDSSASTTKLIERLPQSELLHSEDTTMKILANLQKSPKRGDEPPKREFYTGVLAVRDEPRVALFFTATSMPAR